MILLGRYGCKAETELQEGGGGGARSSSHAGRGYGYGPCSTDAERADARADALAKVQTTNWFNTSLGRHGTQAVNLVLFFASYAHL